IRIRSFGHARDRNDPLLQPVKIDLYRDWTTWPTLTTGAFSATTAGASVTATSIAGTCARLRSACACTDTAIFVTLRQQRTRICFLQHGEIESERRRVIVRSHIEPLRTQTEVGRREKPQILPTRIPRRPRCIRESIGNLLCLACLDVAHEDRVIQRTQ